MMNKETTEMWPDAGLQKAIELISISENEYVNIIDVGGHYGETLITISEALEVNLSYHGFEPDPETFKVFEENAEIVRERKNNMRMSINRAALGPVNGKESFTKTKADAVSGILKPAKGLSERVPSGDHEILSQFDVELITIDSYLAKHEIDKVHLLKVDAEGYDLEVLKGASESLKKEIIDVIVCETFFVSYRENQAYFWDIAKFLQQYNYMFVNIYDTRETGQGRLYTGNGVWVSRSSGINKGYL
jgi:FkbM family methyltransferase